MQDRFDDVLPQGTGGALSRRQVLCGAAVAAIAISAPGVLAATGKKQKGVSNSLPIAGSVRRFMAAAAVLPDGRVLVTGGYDKPWANTSDARALASAMIFDPVGGEWYAAAPMGTPRARHAATTLADGRVMVAGGFFTGPISSVEIYDPRTNSWSYGVALDQPRYDHMLVTEGARVLVIGGSGQNMVSSVESIEPAKAGGAIY